MLSPSHPSHMISWFRARWRSLSRWQRAGAGLAFVTGLLITGTLLLVLDREREPECTPRFCAEVLSPEGEDVDPMTPIRIRLQGVDQSAALEALTISHDPKGTKKFEGDVLVFRPEWPGLARGVSYDVALKLDKAPTAGGRIVDLSASFSVGGKLAIAVVLPSDGTLEVVQDAEVYVQFNRSVAPLTVLSAAGPQNVLSFDPPVEGAGRWLNTSLYVFMPEPGWQPATAYTGRVKAGLTSELGSTLDADYDFHFETVTPSVLAVTPAENSKFVMTEPEIKVEFNQPIDRASAEQRFLLSQFGQTGAPVPGSFEWPDASSFVFRPNAPLVLSGTYKSTVAAGVRAIRGSAATKADFGWTFLTVDPPRVVGTTPANGANNAPNYGVRIQFATPMDRKSVEDGIVIEPKPNNEAVFMSWDPSDLAINVGAQLSYSTAYRVTLSTAARDRSGLALSQPLDLSFTTAAMQPTARMFRSGQIGTFNAYLDPTVMVSSWNVDKLDFKLYRLDQQTFIARQSGKRSPLPESALLRSWSVAITDPPLDKPVVSEVRLDSNGPKLPEGFYVLTLDTPNAPKPPYGVYYNGDELPVVLSSVNLVTKWTDRDLLLWAVDMKTGLPFKDWRFDVIDTAGKSVARGTTGEDGIARIDVKAPGTEPYVSQGYYVYAKRDDRVAFSSSNWSDGINPYSYGSAISSQFRLPPLVGHMFTDRPIYRPNETVYLKGVVRADDDTNYRPPAGQQLDLVIYDQQGRQVDKQNVTLSDFGTFDTSLALAADASTGVYNINLRDPSKSPEDSRPERYFPSITYLSFRVAEFVKPEFEVTVTTDKDSYVNGERINATVSAQFYFGSPLINAEVRWKVTGSRYSYRNESFSGFQTGEYRVLFGCQVNSVFSYEPERYFRQEGLGRTDADGKFSFSLPADVSGDTFSQAFTVEATVVDESQQQVAEFINVPVHKGRFYIGLQPQEYSPRAGKATRVKVATLDPLSNKTAPNIALEVGVFERKWRTVRERGADGQQVYKSVSEDTPVETFGGGTGGDGLGNFEVTLPRSGQFYITVKSKDNLGNVIQSSLVLWASGNEFASWHIPNDDRFTIVPDKEEYKPGDVARILIAAPFEGASTALISQERGKVLAYETRRIAGNSEVLELPIVSSHVPNFYLSVVLFKPATDDNPMPQVKFGLVQIKVSNDEKKLNIALEPSAKRLHPRDSLTYSVRTTDSTGRGVAAEVSLALVDKAVLSLQDDFARSGVEAFWSKRPLGVITASSFVLSIDRANQLAKSLYPGGKGGGGALYDDERSYFPNTAFWEPSLHTDAGGSGTIEVKLPDSTTTWRLTARGITTDTKTGEGRNEIITARDLILRPDLPRFLIAGDEAKIGAIVNNTSEQALDVAVTISATGVQIVGEAAQSITLPAGRSAPVYWPIKATAGSAEAAFSFSADAGSASDGVALKIPVHTYFTAETVATGGEVASRATEAIEVPSYVLPDAGGLTVNVTPSLVAGLHTGYRYLKEYPYESVEATMSRFVVALALERAVKELKLTDVETPIEDTRPLIQRSLQKLYETQQKDGGWGWWRAEAPDPLMTAYVLAGLGEAKRAGFNVDVGVESRAATYLRGELRKPRDVEDQAYDLRAYMLYALARDGRGDLGLSYSLAEQRASLSNTAKAQLALAIKLSGGSTTDPRLTSLLTDLQSAAVASATGTHWEEAQYNRRAWGNSTTTTTQVIQALNALQGENPLIDGAVRWLMIERKDGRWQTSFNTANALLAITDFMLARKDVQQSFDYRVTLNGDTRLEGKADKGRVQQEDSVVIDMRDLTKDALNDLLISREPGAQSRFYYTAQLRYFTPALDIEAASEGIGVSHEYVRADVDDATPVRDVQLGDLVKVKVTLVAPADLNYLVLEDYLPAGLEPVDTSLKITPLDIRRRLAEDARKAYQVNKRYSPFSQAEVRDNRVALFARLVPRGVYEYTYYARATTAGSFHVPPATAYEQYFPEVFGRSDGGTFIVKQAGE